MEPQPKLEPWNERLKRWMFMVLSTGPRIGIRTVNRLISKTTNDRPFYTCEEFSWIPAVEAFAKEIRAEADQMIEYIDDMPTNHDTVPTTAYYFSKRKWHQVGMHIYGTWIEDNCALYPKTREALAKIEGLVAGVISIMPPGLKIPDHIHSYKGTLIYQLAVRVPQDRESCCLRVADQVVSWEEGKSLILDPMYSHETWNNTDEYRVVMLVEIWRPDTPFYLRIFDWIFKFSYRYSPIGIAQIREFNARAAVHRKHVESDDSDEASPHPSHMPAASP